VVGLIIDFSESCSARIDFEVEGSSLPNVGFLLNYVAVDRLKNVNSLCEGLILRVSDINVTTLTLTVPI
jgi:hypothetical protein